MTSWLAVNRVKMKIELHKLRQLIFEALTQQERQQMQSAKNIKDLKKVYKALAFKYHPDRHTQKKDSVKREMEETFHELTNLNDKMIQNINSPQEKQKDSLDETSEFQKLFNLLNRKDKRSSNVYSEIIYEFLSKITELAFVKEYSDFQKPIAHLFYYLSKGSGLTSNRKKYLIFYISIILKIMNKYPSLVSANLRKKLYNYVLKNDIFLLSRHEKNIATIFQSLKNHGFYEQYPPPKF